MLLHIPGQLRQRSGRERGAVDHGFQPGLPRGIQLPLRPRPGAEAEQVGAGSGGGTGFVRAELLRHRTAAPQRRVGHPRRILRLEILRQNRRLLRKKIDQLTES